MLAPGIEIKATGACVVAPPSLHASGQFYRWAPGRGLDIEIPLAPVWILERLNSHTLRQGTDPGELCRGFQEGERNNGMTRLAGLLIGKGISLRLVLPLLLSFDKQFNKPPLGESEIETIVMSIGTRELAKRKAAQ